MRSISERVYRLKPNQVIELHDKLVEAGLCFELEGSHKEVFRRAKHRRIGVLRSIYKDLENIPAGALPTISDIVTSKQPRTPHE